jgi:hypothetical protein
MENTRTRIRVNISQGEIELEGSEKFLEKHQPTIDEFIAEAKKRPSTVTPNRVGEQITKHSNLEENRPKIVNQASINVPGSFGEFYTQFRKGISISDKMLIAGYYIQCTSDDGLFVPKDSAVLLNEQNVKITNPNAFVKSLLNGAKLYKQAGKFKVSESGIDYIKQLLTQL